MKVNHLTLSSLTLLALSGGRAAEAQLANFLYSVDGDGGNHHLGVGLSSVADLDGDGLPDFCAGTAMPSFGPGYVRAFRGVDGSTLWTYIDGDGTRQFGHGLELVGDCDGDGISDLVVGSPQASGNCGRAYLVSTQSLAPLHTFPGVCSAPDSRFGSGVGRLGDITGDGVPEFTIAASSADPCCGHYVGTINAYDGATYQSLWQANGTQGYDYARQKLGKDINGDGIQEVTWSSTQHGFSPVGPGFLRLHDGATGAELLFVGGVNVDDHFGDAWALLDDVTGDGVFDLVVAVPRGDTFGADAGEIQLRSGADGSLVYAVPGLPSESNHGWGHESGGSVCELPDLDGDGLPDYACGNGTAFDPAVGAAQVSGCVGIYSGATGALLDLLVGEQDGDFFGGSVRYASGMAGSSSRNLVVSASGHGGGAGRIYVFDLPGQDCNSNGVPDEQDLSAGTSSDCDGNGIPDECDSFDPALDCDLDGVLDSCQIAADTRLDCDMNGVLDSCDLIDVALDCDLNGVLDSCQLLSDPSLDCDGNGVLDSCDILADAGLDQNLNGTVDSCECSATSYCLAVGNSNGTQALLSAQGSLSMAANDFAIRVDGATPLQVGLMFYGAQQTFTIFGEGVRCVATPIYRLVPVLLADAQGSATYPLDFSAAPAVSGPGAIHPFSSWNFQFWYRDPLGGPAGFNFSDGLSVTFCP